MSTILYYNNSFFNECEKFYFQYVTSLDIRNAILSVKSNATENDLIAIRMIKPIINNILPVLTHLFKYSLQFSCFPDDWRKAIILPIPKVTKPNTAKDYRAISLLPVVSKILEKIVFD
jgi:hypothetical protein